MNTSFAELDEPALGDSRKTNLAYNWDNVQKRCIQNSKCKGMLCIRHVKIELSISMLDYKVESHVLLFNLFLPREVYVENFLTQ